MVYKRIISFDFDDTLCHTPSPEEGKKIWLEKTGKPWPYIGWWGKSESIMMYDDQGNKIFDIPVNKWVYEKYLIAVSDPENYVILATGRLLKSTGMLENVKKILNLHNLSFNEIHLNWGGDTFRFKTSLFEQLIKKIGVKELVMYDDRQEHLLKFEEWANTQSIPVTIVDVVNKNETTFKNEINYGNNN